MKAAVIAIGDELTSGQRVDTNSAWLSQRLSELGIPVFVHLTSADDLQACANVIQFATAHADLVIATGGLGPTADDLTRDAIAAATGCELAMNESVLAQIEEMFQSRGRTMPESNRRQALFPSTSKVISNPHGTAPGIDLTIKRNGRATRIFALPGVPAEMREMWEQALSPALADMVGGNRVILHRRIQCFGIGESACEQLVPDLIVRGRVPQVGITVHRATITLRVTAEGASRDSCLAIMQPTIDTIHRQLGDFVFGEEDDELQDIVVRMLADRNETLAVSETDTLGIMTNWLCEANDRNRTESFHSGIVCRRDGASHLLSAALPSDGELLSESTGRVARLLRERLGTTYGLAISPFPANDQLEFQIALSTAQEGEEDVVVSRSFAGHPKIRVERSAKQALDFLRRRLAERSSIDNNGSETA